MRKLVSTGATALLVAGLLGVVTAAPVGSSSFPGDNGKIAFVMQVGGDDEIFSMNPDGSGQRNLTNHPAADDNGPNWSADGEKIAFVRGPTNSREVFVMNADGSGQTQLTSNDDEQFHPSWSPNGKKIAFTRRVAGDAEIIVMNADGSGQTQLTSIAGFDGVPSWSPDGKKIAFTSDRNGPDQIFVMNADGSNQVNVTTLGNDFLPCWSPDAEEIVFTRSVAPAFGEIFVIDADGSNERRLTNSAADDFSPCFSPDGEQIVFASQLVRGGDDILVMDADGSNVRNITNSPTILDFDPNWQPREAEGDVTVTKWVNGTAAPGTTFEVKVDCDGEQDDKVLTFGEAGGTQSFERETFGPLECEVTETQTGGATTVEITCTADKNAECDKPDAFTLFDDPSDDGSNVEINVVNTFPITVEPNFTG